MFEIVAVNVASSLPDFQTADRTSRRFQLRILRQAIEKSPAELQLILRSAWIRDIDTRWTFWVVSNDMDAYAANLARSANRPEGVIWQSDDSRKTIWVRTWFQILIDARARLRVFQKELNYSADRDASIEFLRESYACILSGDDKEDEGAREEEEAAAPQ